MKEIIMALASIVFVVGVAFLLLIFTKTPMCISCEIMCDSLTKNKYMEIPDEIKIEKMYLEDVTGKGEYILTLEDKNGNKYQGETDEMRTHDLIFYKVRQD